MKTLEEIRNYFLQDKFATDLGIEILSADDEKSVCRVPIPALQKNALGRVQGGFLFTLADFAFAVAANIHCVGTVTVTGTIHFLAAPKGDFLMATARRKQGGKRLCLYEVSVCDDSGKEVCFATFTGSLPPCST